MQLKGLIRFFTILLIIYSIYELSFTWVVRGHEKKMEARAKQFVSLNYPNADSATKDQAYKDRYRRLIDSTKDETVHFGITGPISYQKAKEEELNLGLDLHQLLLRLAGSVVAGRRMASRPTLPPGDVSPSASVRAR